MPRRRRYDLAGLWSWIWMQDGGVTARMIAEYLGCSGRYVHDRILPSMEQNNFLLADVGKQKTGHRPAALYEPLRPDENEREK